MRRPGAPGDPYVKQKVLAGLGLVATVLIWLLAWTLGSTVQEQRDLQWQGSIEKTAAVLRDRLKNCQSETLRFAAHMGKNELDVDRLRQDNELLERENSLLQQTNDDLEKSTLECEEDAQSERDRHAELGQASVQDVIDRMRFENKNLESAKDQINATNKARAKTLREQVWAYRMENALLHKSLAQKEAEAQAEAAKAAEGADAAAATQAGERPREAGASAAGGRPGGGAAAAGGAAEAEGSSSACTDKKAQCSGWARRGECERNVLYMHRVCPRSCGACAPPDIAAEGDHPRAQRRAAAEGEDAGEHRPRRRRPRNVYPEDPDVEADAEPRPRRYRPRPADDDFGGAEALYRPRLARARRARFEAAADGGAP